MPLRRARTVDELAERTRGAEAVLTAQAPLALALNRRSPGARLGDQAATPKALATRGLETPDRRELFHHVVRATGQPFKQAATRLDLVLDAWEATGEPDGVLAWDRYDVPGVRAVVDALADVETAHGARTAADPVEGDVAVVGLEDFTALDRRVLPEPYHEPPFPDEGPLEIVDPFAPGEHAQLDDLRVLPSRHALARTVEQALTPANADRVAVVVPPDDPLRTIVEATLDARSVPYQREDDLAENPGARVALRALRLALAGDRLTGRDVRGLRAALGHPASPRGDRRRLAAMEDRAAERLADTLADLPGAPLGEALDAVADLARDATVAGGLAALREPLEDLDTLDEPVTRELVNALAFYLDTYDVREDRRAEGVLVTSAHRNAYVDRPLVLHLGLDDGWARPVPGYPWVERGAREARDRSQLERLLQAGDRSVHLVQATRAGEPVRPCLDLHELVDEDVSTFEDLVDAGRATRNRAPEPAEGPDRGGFEPEPVDADRREVGTLSAGDVDALAHCPRDWYVDQLVEPVAREPLARGTALHAFAEVYAHHPEAVDLDDPDALGAIVDVALDEVADLAAREDEPVLATQLRVGLQATAAWLDENPPTGAVPGGFEDPPEDHPAGDRANPFAEHLGLEADRPRAERWFDEPDLGLRGLVDLLHGPTRLVDWKTGPSPASRPRTVRRARAEGDDPPRIQPAAYLARLRRARPDHALTCTLVDVLADPGPVLRGTLDPEDLERELPLHPAPFEAWAASREAFDALTQAGKDRQRILNAIGPEAYVDRMEAADLPAFRGKDAAEEHPFVEELAEAARQALGEDYKYIEDGARSTARKLVDLRGRSLFREDLDRVEALVDEVRRRLDGWLDTRFPVGTDELDEVEHRDLVLRRAGPTPEAAPDPIGGSDA